MRDAVDVRSAVLKYYAYRATNTAGFIAPIFTLFLLRDLSFTAIGALSGLYSVLLVVGEVPTGYVGDRVGRRNSLIAGKLFATASLWLFLVVDTFPGFAATYVLWAGAMTFASGSASAWLYDTLAADLDEESFTRVSGRGGAVDRWVTAGMMIGGAVLYAVDPVYPFVAGGAVGLVGVGVLLSMPKNVQYADPPSGAGPAADEDGSADGDADRFTIVDALPLIRDRLTAPPLRAFVLYVGLFFGAVGAADQYVQPVAVGVLDPFVRPVTVGGVRLAEEAAMGLLYAGFTAVTAVASYYAGPLEDRFGLRRVVVLTPAVVAVLFVLPTALPLVALPAFVGMRAGRAVVKPMTDRYVNDHVGSAGRATVLSAASMVYGLARTPFVVAAGVLADATSALSTLPFLGVLLVVPALALAALDGPIAGESDAATDDDATADATAD